MISKDQINIYLKYNADVDGFARCATELEHSLLTDDVWLLLDDIIFDLHLLKSDLASKENVKSITDKLEEHIRDESLIKMLFAFSSKE